MYYSVLQSKMCLPFGKVLTKIFEMENISLDGYPLLEPRSPFCKRNLGQMHYNSYLVPITMDSCASKKKDQARASTSGQPEAPAQQEVAVHQEDPSSFVIPLDQPALDVPSPSTHPGTSSTLSSIPADSSIPSPPPSLSETQPLPVVTESTTIPAEPLVTQAEIPPSSPPTQNLSQSHPSPTDPDQPIIEDDVDDDVDGTHQYSPLRDEDLSPSPPHTSPPTSSIPLPPFSIPPSAKSACVPPKPTFYFEQDTSMTYDQRWLAHFSKECYYNTVNTMIADSNARAWETHHMMQAGFQALNPSIRLPPPTMHPFIPVPNPSPVMRTHHLLCMQKKSEAIRQKRRAAAMLSSIRPPTLTSSTFPQTSFTTPATSIPIMTTKPIASTSTFAPVSVSSTFASLPKGLGIRPPTPPEFLSSTDIPITASPEVSLISEALKENSSIDFSKFASPSSLSSSLPQASTSAAPSPAPPVAETTSLPETSSTSVPESTSVSQPAAEATPVPETTPAAETATTPVSSQAQETPAKDSPEEPLRWKRTKKATPHPSRPAKKKKLVVSPPPPSTDASPPPAPSSSPPPIPLPFQVAHPTTEELCTFLMSQKKK